MLGFLSEKHDFDRAEVQEVIDDLGQEVAYSATPKSANTFQGQPVATSQQVGGALSEMGERIESMERTLNRILAMMRKLLHAMDEKPDKIKKIS